MNVSVPAREKTAVDPRDTNHHPYSRYLAAVFAFLFDQSGRMLLLREQDNERKYMCDLPGGTLTDDEQPVNGLYREVFEETGLPIRLLSPLCWLKSDIHDSGCPILVAFYIAETSQLNVSLSPEHNSFRWVPIEEFRREGLEVSADPEIVEACFARYVELTAR
jgi:ADP-ribose pyrophosphatase YjhB (NUDIX family)